MALRLTDLQSRVNSKGRTHRTPRERGSSPTMAMNNPRRQVRSLSQQAGGSDLLGLLMASGASESEAQRIAGLVEKAENAEAMARPRALSAPTPVPLPRAQTASNFAAEAILSALRLTPFGAALDGMFALCDSLDVAISLGVGYLAGLGVGGGQTVGVVIGPNRTVGYFSSIGQVVGFIVSVSGSISFSIVRGGISAFNGQSVTIGFTVGVDNPAEPISPGAGYHQIYNMSGDWIGVTGEISLSAGLSPVEVFAGAWQTGSQTLQVPTLSVPAYHRHSAAQSSTNPIRVNARYRAFIPSPAIAVELPLIGTDIQAFSGDGRGFSFDGGTSRAQIDARLQMRGYRWRSEIESSSAVWGESKQYDLEDVFEVQGKPSWWRGINGPARVLDRATLQRTPENLGVSIGGSGTRDAVYGAISTDSMFSFHVDGGIPLMPSAAPNINARIRLLLRDNNSQIEAKCEGQHDGFPAHEVYVEGIRVYGYDPLSAGNGPISLGGLLDGDIDVNTGWVHIGAVGEIQSGTP